MAQTGARRPGLRRLGRAEQDRRLELTIADNGRGGARESASGMGLTNMRQRAISLPGAEFSIVSPEGGGTLVRLQFDLEDR